MSALAEVAVDELDALSGMLQAVGASSGSIAVLVHPGQPTPQARSRSGKGRHFTPEHTRHAQQALATSMLALRSYFANGFGQGNIALACIFYRGDRHTCDGDNLQKLVCDAGTNAGLWRDDSQVTGGAWRIELDRLHPRTVLAISPHQSTLRRDLVRVK